MLRDGWLPVIHFDAVFFLFSLCSSVATVLSYLSFVCLPKVLETNRNLDRFRGECGHNMCTMREQ